METGPMLFVDFLQQHKHSRSVGLSPVSQRGLSVFLCFLMGFSVKSNGVGDHWMGFQ